MESKYNDNIFLYNLTGNDYEIGKQYAKLLIKRGYNIKIISKALDDYKNNIEYDIYKTKIEKIIDTTKKNFSDYIRIEKGFCEELGIDIDIILELQLLSEMSGIFCTIIADNNKLYRILDTSKEHRNFMINNFNEIHILNINYEYSIIIYPGVFLYHTVLSNNFSFSIFGNNKLCKDLYFKNKVNFYIKLKKYFLISKNEYEFITYFKNDKEIYYDAEIIINGDKNHIIDVYYKEKSIINKSIIERSDYSPIKSIDYLNIHRNLPIYNRIFVLFYNKKNNILYLNNSLINDEFVKINFKKPFKKKYFQILINVIFIGLLYLFLFFIKIFIQNLSKIIFIL